MPKKIRLSSGGNVMKNNKRVALFLCGKIDDSSIMSTKCVINTLLKVIDGLVIIDPFAGNKLKKIVTDGTEIIKYDVKNLGGWKEIYKYNRELLESNNIDTMIVFKVILAEGFKHGDMGQILRFKRERKQNDIIGFNFNQTKNVLTKFSLVESASVICTNVYHFILDPQEASFEDVCNFNNFKKLYGMKRDGGYKYMPCFEYGVNENAKHIEKKKDFVFYCSAVTEDRAYIVKIKDKLESIEGWDVRINVPKAKVKPLKQNEYYDKLAEARYSLCIPAYNKTAFSMYRFIEAACNDCLCFIHKDVCLDDAKNTFPDIYNIMVEHLIVDNFKHVRRNIKSVSENDRQDILRKIKSTKSWNKIMELENIRKMWSKLEGINE